MTDAPSLLRERTEALCERHRAIRDRHDDAFAAAKELVSRLGGHWRGTHAEFGFWTPELADTVPAADVRLEIFTPAEPLDLTRDDQVATFDRALVPTRREGEFTWAAVEGVRAGTRDTVGSLYRLTYDVDGTTETVGDPLARSLPFGAFAPAELYDMARIDAERGDRGYFEALGTPEEPVGTTPDDGLPRIDPATSMLEIHPGTATEAGSLGGLARLFERIGEKQRAGEALTPAERNFAGYDAVQLMPVEPITEHEDHPGFWRPRRPEGDRVEVTLERPAMINWGYDIVVAGFSAVNPAILETGRPDELVDFIAACHAMPDPVRVVFDIALGHADNGGLDLLNDRYFAGPGMYGQNLEYTHPVVRAILLEMQRRKMDFGADGIRVDGAQDFTNWDPETETEVHDDAFLAEMDRVVQSVGDRAYRPWMIYEDGRPWPEPDWELASTYRALREQHEHAFQWSPVTFAHNTPALLTFWATKWWRIREVADLGGRWITGVANHDTLRRGTQRDVATGWEESPPNPYLGETPFDVFEAAYNNPAANALFHCFMPGVPMDFAHANMRAPWGFVRDTDADWHVKVVADEANLVDWQIRPEHYRDPDLFTRLKDLGFDTREELGTFVHALDVVGELTEYDRDAMARTLTGLGTPLGEVGSPDLEAFATAWTNDVHEFRKLHRWHDRQGDERTRFDLAVRSFRQARPWLAASLGPDDHFAYRHPADGTVLYYGLRRGPSGETVLYVGNMEGQPATVVPADLPVSVGSPGDWHVALAAPGVEVAGVGDAVTLRNAETAVFTR